MINTIKSTHLNFGLFSLASMISRSFQTVRRVRQAWKWGNICSVSSVRVGSQIHPHVSPMLGEEYSNIPSPGDQDWSNALPQGQQRQSNPHPMPSFTDQIRWKLNILCMYEVSVFLYRMAGFTPIKPHYE